MRQKKKRSDKIRGFFSPSGRTLFSYIITEEPPTFAI